MSNTVAGDADVLVRRIFPPPQLMVQCVLTQIRPRDAEQRPQQALSDRRHCRQTCGTGAAKKSEQNGLGLIIGVMSQQNPRRPDSIRCTPKKDTPTCAGSHLRRLSMSCCMVGNVGQANGARQPCVDGQLTNEDCVLTGITAQLMVQMGHVELPLPRHPDQDVE